MTTYNWPLMENTMGLKERFSVAKFAITADKFTKGQQCLSFEKEWNDWLRSENSLFVSSGSTANFLLVSAVMEKYGLRRGDKVLLPACTWVTNVAPIIQLGLEPIFCDINLKDFSFDKESMQLISKIHSDIKLIFVTHLLGLPASTENIKNIFPDAIIIDDVCESHGAKDSNGNKVGSDSTGATFSFYYGHHMTTIEGGMISTNDFELYDIMKMKRSHGMARESEFFNGYAEKYPELSSQFLFITDGYNFRNHEIPAIIGRIQLKKLDRSIDIRRKNFFLFKEYINMYSDKFYFVEESVGNSSFCLPIVSKDKTVLNKLKLLLKEEGIESRPVVGGNLLRHPFLRGYELVSAHDKPNADIVNELGLYVGNSQFVKTKDIDKLGRILNGC